MKGEIIEERDVKNEYGRGRPAREYLYQRETWVSSAQLPGPGLLQIWKEKNAQSVKRTVANKMYATSPYRGHPFPIPSV